MKGRVKSFRGEGHDVDCRCGLTSSRIRCQLVKLAMMLHELDISGDVSSDKVRVERKTKERVLAS